MHEKNAFCMQINGITDGKKIKISPVGANVKGVDERVYEINGVEVLKQTLALGADLFLDKNHEDNEAMGWFNELELKNDGIYANLTLTPKGEELVKNKIYRYLSPVYDAEYKDRKIKVTRILNVGLVNRPNLLKKALNKEGEKMPEENIESLKTQIADLKKALEAANSTIEALKKQIKDEADKVKREKVENLVKNGLMLGTRKDTALNLDGAAFDSYIDVCKVEANSILKKKEFDADKQKTDEIDEKVKNMLGI